MQRSIMRTMVRDLARVEAHDVDDTQLDVYLDEGYLEVTSHADWPWCYSLTPITQLLVAGTDEYALSTTIKRVLGVQNTTQKYSLQSVAQADWAKMKNIPDQGYPLWFTWVNGTLHLSPSPTAADTLTIEYYAHPTFATADSGTPDFDEAFHQLLVDWALSRLWEMEEDFEKADDYRSRYEIRLVRMGKFYNTWSEDRPRIFGDRKLPDYPGPDAWYANAAQGS